MATRRILSHGLGIAAGLIVATALLASGTAMGSEPESEDPAVVVVDRSGLLYKSGSAMEMPEYLRNWSTLEPPGARGPSRNLAEDPLEQVIFNPLTGEETILPSIPRLDDGQERMVDGFVGSAASTAQTKSVIGADDRVVITNVTTFPWNTVVKLYINATDGATGICSGMMIDAFHVLTAGHCVYLWDHGGWADAIRLVPGMDQGYWPYNYAWGVNFRSYTGWTVDENHEHDWAMITLDRNVGNFTGAMGRWTAASSHSWYTGTLNLAGYPGDLSYGERMYFDADVGRTTNEYNHWYYMDSAGGMSGGPVWVYDNGNRYITTIHAYGDDGSGSNHGTRLNQEKFDTINTWVGLDTPPTDRADLVDDGDTYSGFTPTTVTRDVTSYSAWNDTRNVGTAASGGFYIDFYASTNTVISTSDYLISRKYVASISALNEVDVSQAGTFPQSVAAGTYYVGWILDANGDVTEFDETNNTAYTTGQITVLDPCSPDTHEPNNTAASANHIAINSVQNHSLCLEGDVDFVWFYIGEESTLTLGTDGPNGGDTVIELFNSSLVSVGFNDDGGPGQFSLITGVYPAGVYRLGVNEFGDNDYIQSYSISIDAVSTVIFADGFESGNTSAW